MAIREYLIIRTTITQKVIKHFLIKGFIIAFFGILLLAAGAVFLPLPTLQTWGWILFLVSLGLITFGLLPYRRIVRLQLKPNEISLLNAEQFTFFSRQRKKLTLSLQSIEKIQYIDHPLNYGIAIWLKHPTPIPVIVHENPKEIEEMQKTAQEMENADLFLRYFNRHSFEELLEWISKEYTQTTSKFGF